MTISKIDIKDLSSEEFELALKNIGAESYRAKQITRWLYKMGARSFNEMKDLPESLRRALSEKFHITHPVMLDSRISKMDDTAKYLLKLEDAGTIETVFLPERDRATICLSSQVGCKFACSFCASAPFGFIRNLKSSEIIDEVLFIKHKHPLVRVTNLVFMGIGEPFDNYDNVMKAARIFNNPDAFNIGARKITISTCGIIPGIKKLEKEGMQIELSVSLHSADDDTRSRLLPVNKRYPIKELMAACREYTDNTDRVITFEYILIPGVNCSAGEGKKLVKLLSGLKCKVNLIGYNLTPISEKFAFEGNKDKAADNSGNVFFNTLKDSGINVTRRKSKGADIDAACGQLRISKL